MFNSPLRNISLCLFVCMLRISTAHGQDGWNPRTEHGQPNFQGIWYFGSTTPFTRPSDLGTQKTYSKDDARAVEISMRDANLAQELPLEANRTAPELGATIGFAADFNFATKRHLMTAVRGEYRTSLIIEPSDGQIPINKDFEDFHDRRRARGIETYDGPEAQDSGERCLSGGLAVPSLYPMPWNANMQIVQTQDYVMIMTEMNHDARIIPLLKNKEAAKFPRWMGHSTARFEETTLVIHTTQFREEQSNFLMAMSAEFELTEWFELVNEQEIVYRYRVSDPLAYTEDFVVERTLTRREPEALIYEVACHEGNYSMTGVLAGARREEMDEAN